MTKLTVNGLKNLVALRNNLRAGKSELTSEFSATNLTMIAAGTNHSKTRLGFLPAGGIDKVRQIIKMDLTLDELFGALAIFGLGDYVTAHYTKPIDEIVKDGNVISPAIPARLYALTIAPKDLTNTSALDKFILEFADSAKKIGFSLRDLFAAAASENGRKPIEIFAELWASTQKTANATEDQQPMGIAKDRHGDTAILYTSDRFAGLDAGPLLYNLMRVDNLPDCDFRFAEKVINWCNGEVNETDSFAPDKPENMVTEPAPAPAQTQQETQGETQQETQQETQGETQQETQGETQANNGRKRNAK